MPLHQPSEPRARRKEALKRTTSRLNTTNSQEIFYIRTTTTLKINNTDDETDSYNDDGNCNDGNYKPYNKHNNSSYLRQ